MEIKIVITKEQVHRVALDVAAVVLLTAGAATTIYLARALAFSAERALIESLDNLRR